MTSVADSPVPTPGLRFGRIAVTALLLEAVLFAVLVPIGVVYGMPGGGNGTNFTVFFTAVPIGCLVFGYLFGMWLGRRVSSHYALHGTLLGVVALLIYLAVCSIPPNTIAIVAAGYGPIRFTIVNALRLVGCVAGATLGRRR